MQGESNQILYVKELKNYKVQKTFFCVGVGELPIVTGLLQPEPTWSSQSSRFWNCFTLSCFWKEVINVNAFSNSFLLNWKMWHRAWLFDYRVHVTHKCRGQSTLKNRWSFLSLPPNKDLWIRHPDLFSFIAFRNATAIRLAESLKSEFRSSGIRVRG